MTGAVWHRQSVQLCSGKIDRSGALRSFFLGKDRHECVSQHDDKKGQRSEMISKKIHEEKNSRA